MDIAHKDKIHANIYGENCTKQSERKEEVHDDELSLCHFCEILVLQAIEL